MYKADFSTINIGTI